MKPQHRNSPLIDRVRIDLAEAVFVRNHFAASGKADVGSIHAAGILSSAQTPYPSYSSHTPSNYPTPAFRVHPEFNVISAQEIILAIELPPRHIHVHPTDAVVIVRRHFFQLREISVHLNCQLSQSNNGRPLRRNWPVHRGTWSNVNSAAGAPIRKRWPQARNALACTRFSVRVALSI